MNVFKALARLFTLPKKVRKQLAANPLTPIVQGVLANELNTVISSTVAAHVSDPTTASAVTTAIGAAISNTGIFN